MGCFNNSPLDHHDIPWKPWMMSGLQAMWKKWPKFRGLFRVCGKRGGKMWSKHVKTTGGFNIHKPMVLRRPCGC